MSYNIRKKKDQFDKFDDKESCNDIFWGVQKIYQKQKQVLSVKQNVIL